ncbi:c-type cytochrome [Lichenibacterium dinghuense]|uniref:c-type cytochrome n=1 Tax=Lichenibacterium dinghuense TaxID=2895977 RepID=UPI001F1BDB8C|nr:cytochrome c [Lichenibacterium sp. 6Y81]
MQISLGTVAFGLVVAAGITLAIVGSPESRGRQQAAETRAAAAAAAAEAAAPKTASADGVTLTSVSFTLPTNDREYPAGPHADAINGNCLSCHSAGMVLTQPELSRAEWQGEVNKMVKVYKAPVSPEDAAAVVEYLAQLKPGR